MKLILATSNNGKIREINDLFSKTGVDFISLRDCGELPPLVEDGNTFKENAFKKAITVFKATGINVVSEDSGLEVFALNGAPGIFSARFAGEGAGDRENNEKLLNMLKKVPEEERGARFVSLFCLIIDGHASYFEGDVKGRIIHSPAGQSGFGYDPLFVPEGYDKTFAQLGGEIKNRISHRAVALDKLKKFLLSP